MVVRKVFGVYRDIDIPDDAFPTAEELEYEDKVLLPGSEHGWIQSTHPKGYYLHYRKFLPPKNKQPPKAIVASLHGLNGHASNACILRQNKNNNDGNDDNDDNEKSDNQDKKLNAALQSHRYVEEEGFAFYTIDMIGFGYSEGKRYYFPNLEILVQDYLKFLCHITSFHEEGTPLFLSGASFGGVLTLLVAKQIREEQQQQQKKMNLNVRGLLLLGPGVFPPLMQHFFLNPAKISVKVLLMILYSISPSKDIYEYFQQERLLPVSQKIQTQGCYRDPQILELHLKDKLRRFDGKLPSFRSIITCIDGIQQAVDTITCTSTTMFLMPPVCILHGRKDPIVPVSGAEYLFHMLSFHSRNHNLHNYGTHHSKSAKDHELHIFADAVHDLVAEPNANEIMNIKIQFIHKHLGRPKKRKTVPNSNTIHNSNREYEMEMIQMQFRSKL